jgi:dipeptidyl-peptidase 4
MKKFLFPIALLITVAISKNLSAQKKLFTYEQAFKGASTNVTKPLPVIKGWVDDEHYIVLTKSESGSTQLQSVDVKTGTAVPYTGKESEQAAPSASSLGLDSVKNITLSPDGKWVAFTKNNNLFSFELATKKQVQLTNDGSDVILNGYSSWVYFEEILGRPTRYRAFWWSPDSKHIAFMRFDESQVPEFPIFIFDGQHGYLEKQRYPKAGDKNPEVKIGITPVDQPSTLWADFNASDDQYFGMPYWTKSNQLWVQWMNRGQDNLKIYEIDGANGSKKEIYDEKQKTWIDLDETERVQFLESGKAFILKSDKDGWENLYLYDMTGKFINQITTGNFWGTTILAVDEKAKQVYIKARKENSARFDIYKIGLDGKGLTRLSFGDYSHDQVSLSPNNKYFITTYSNLATPPAMALVTTKGKLVREIANSKGVDFANFELPKTELVKVKSADGLFDLPVAITYPINFDPQKRYPVLVSIYGGPNAGTVYDRWKPVGGSNQWWAQEGVIQVAFDNRSSGHFGKNGLNYIHRQLGIFEIEDYMTCGRWLKTKSWVDTTKLAITGGSFGGYMTCMALTYGSDVFDYGIANSSVTDWMFYDSHYTERFMDMPTENPEGYKKTSVLTYVNKYKGLLRITHGTSDDNVHMQNSMHLISKLQDLNKHFEFMAYPNERHSVGANLPSKGLHSRTEAYQFFYQNLLNKPLPAFFRDTVTQAQQRAF